jgi:hypothetical protein
VLNSIAAAIQGWDQTGRFHVRRARSSAAYIDYRIKRSQSHLLAGAWDS